MVPANGGSPASGDGSAPIRERVGSALTRRRLLLVGSGLIGAGALGQLRTDAPDAPPFGDGVWPLADRDAERTSAAPSATPPTDPEVAWRRELVPVVDSLVVGPERLYVGSGEREKEPPRVAALDREDGTVLWTVAAPGARVAYAGGSVFATGSRTDESGARTTDEPRGAVARLDAATGEARWRRSVRNAGERLLVTRRAVYVGSHGGLAAFDRGRGSSLFRARLSGGPATPLLADGSLVVAGGSVGRYARRRWSDVVLKRLSEPVWSRRPIGYTLDPTVLDVEATRTGAGIATGSFGLFGDEGAALRTHALADGTRRWHAVDAGRLPDPTVAKELAADGDRLFHGVRTGTDAERNRRLVCRDAATGGVRWRRSLPNWLREVVVGGDLVLAGTRLDAVASGSSDGPDDIERGSGRPPGRVTALSTDGDVRWRRSIGGAVSQVVPVGDRVFVGTDDLDYGGRSGAAGRVVALE